MNQKKKYKPGNPVRRLCVFAAVLCLLVMTGTAAFAAEENTKLQNGSFEEGQTWTDNYKQLEQSVVPAWYTTAYNPTVIELLRRNSNFYIPNVTVQPTAGNYAAELNADEESTLYQNVKTTPSSIYEWGLDHGARNGTDTMALIIGPKQNVDPSKPSKTGRDQLMQMVDWLIGQGKTSVKTSAGLGEQLTVYSKKFAASGTFEDNAGNNAFSLTPSAIYTEEWHIWIMADSKATSGVNPWGKYGSNTEGSAGSSTGSGSTTVDLSKYYLYTVPAGQTDTLFAFVSVGFDQPATSADKAKTYGNFLDNINFQIYHPLSGSTTTHGSAVVGGSDGTTGGTGSSTGHTVSVDNKLATYVKDGEPLRIQAIVKQADVDDGCEFVGVYYTTQDSAGDPQTVFLQLAGNVVTSPESGKWLKSTNAAGDVIYTYSLGGIASATDLHFVFIKSPTITYDPNGGKPYVVERTYNTDEAANVYSFKPAVFSAEGVDTTAGATPDNRPTELFISPYVSKAAEGQNDGWKFMGWLLTGDTVDGVSADIQVNADQLGSLLLPAEHTVACDYAVAGVSSDSKAQYFKIYNGQASLSGALNRDVHDEITGVTWEENGAAKAYANVHRGLTLVAQWRWRQAFIPQTGGGTTYTDSDAGGTVEITSVTDTSDTNYNAAYNTTGGKSYHAETDETITATAAANTGYAFEGWYDATGNQISTNATYSYTETKESVNTYYARFSPLVTQTYTRQVWNGNTWEDTTDDTIGTLGRYTYTDAVGMPISSTATAGTSYKFVGWYDSDGNKVADSMLINNGATISYTTTGDATYYARFVPNGTPSITQTYIRQVGSGNTWADTLDDSIGTLDRYTYTDVAGVSICSTATAGAGYKFMGWYDSAGNQVADTMLTDSGATISYITTGDATYYARFEKTYTVNFAAQTKQANGNFVENTAGGIVSESSVTGIVNTSANSTATANTGYKFLGWYDASGNLLSMEATFSTTTSSATNGVTCYARFAPTVTQTYIRQVKNGDTWVDTNEDSIGTLNRYTHSDEAGIHVSSTATAGAGYKFVGWYDSTGNAVTDTMLTDNGATISYITTGDSTYYARFEKTYTVRFAAQTKQANGSFAINTAGGNVSVAFVTDVNGADASSTATSNSGYKFLGWYDEGGSRLSSDAIYSTTTSSPTDGKTYFARFEVITYTVNFVSQTKQANGDFVENTTGGIVSESSVTGIVNTSANSTATANTGYKFLGWYDASGNLLSMEATFSTTTSSATNGVTYYARFEKTYTVNFAAQTKQENGSFVTDTAGGTVTVDTVTGVNGAAASSTATANTGYRFLGWYDTNGNPLSSNTIYTATITSAANEATYYARFEAIPPATPTPTATAVPTPAPTTTPTTAPTSAPSTPLTATPAPMPVPTPAQTTETHSIPRTGDEFPLIPVIAAGVISAVGIVLMLRVRKQR